MLKRKIIQPDLFGVNSTVGSITGSTSFWVQNMFSSHRGTTILPVTASASFGPVYWVASSATGAYYVKLANYGSSMQAVTVRWTGETFSNAATLTLLSGPELTANYPGIVSITPKTSSLSGNSSAGYTFSMPAWSVAVLAVTL